MKIIFGLGNPGGEFNGTYHNAGFMALDGCLDALNLKKNKEMCNGIIYEANVGGQKVYFVYPTTYMNLSGQCVKATINKLKANISDILVVVDDFDLPAGSLRIRAQGSAGTHNGLRSIVGLCGTNFARLRVGTGNPHAIGQDAKDFVLSKSASKNKDFLNGVQRATQAVLDYARGATLDDLMQRYNSRGDKGQN